MNIRKIVLADDETLQRNVLCSIIQKVVPTEIELCSNGQEALEAIERGGVELLITDIRMPVMDGIELITRVAEKYPKIKIVLVSAYSEFEYAKTAISCGVSEYLLKPFRPEEVRKLLIKLDAEISASRNLVSLSFFENLRQKSKTDTQYRYLLSLLDGRKSAVPKDFSVGEALSRRGALALIRWKSRSPLTASDLLFSGNALSDQQQEYLTERIHALFPDAVLLLLNKGINSNECKLALLLPDSSPEEIFAAFSVLAEECRKKLLIFWAALSEFQENLLSSLSTACQQAELLLAFSFYFPEKLQLFSLTDKHTEFITPPPMFSLLSYEKTLRDAARTGDLSALSASLKELKCSLKKEPFIYPSDVRHRISSMVVTIIRDLDGMISSREYDDLLNQAYSLYSLCDSLDDLFCISLHLLECASAYFTQENGQYDAVEDIIAYIKKHFTEELSLQQLADNVHFSANYLSTQIKKKTGMSYISYITLLRTELASRLLIDTNLKVADVAARCGYRDSSYFNRIFCRKYGVSPEQYRKAHKKC